MHHPNIEIIIIGDRLSKSSQITVGGGALAKIREIKADISFLGINAINIEDGITDSDWDIVQLKQAMIESSSKAVALTISEKMNTAMRLKVCNVKDIDVLITELKPDNELLKSYATSGIEII